MASQTTHCPTSNPLVPVQYNVLFSAGVRLLGNQYFECVIVDRLLAYLLSYRHTHFFQCGVHLISWVIPRSKSRWIKATCKTKYRVCGRIKNVSSLANQKYLILEVEKNAPTCSRLFQKIHIATKNLDKLYTLECTWLSSIALTMKAKVMQSSKQESHIHMVQRRVR